MTDEAAAPTSTKKRRTAAELKAHYLSKAKEAEEREKGDVLRLISDAHDTLSEAMSLEAHKPHAQALQQAKTQIVSVITALSPPKK